MRKAKRSQISSWVNEALYDVNCHTHTHVTSHSLIHINSLIQINSLNDSVNLSSPHKQLLSTPTTNKVSIVYHCLLTYLLTVSLCLSAHILFKCNIYRARIYQTQILNKTWPECQQDVLTDHWLVLCLQADTNLNHCHTAAYNSTPAQALSNHISSKSRLIQCKICF